MSNFVEQQAVSSNAAATIDDWITLDAFSKRFPNIPEKTIRWQLTSRHQNGLSPYIQIIGKQRYISVQGYATWLTLSAGSADTLGNGGVK